MRNQDDLLFERGLPANIDAERYVLGSILLHDDRYPDVAGVLAQEDFSLEKHRRIFLRMKDLYDRGEHVDRVTLPEELRRHGQLESVDGLSYLVSLDEGLPELANLDGYIRIVKEKALLRETMFACQSIIHRCALASDSSSEILETAAAVLEQVRSKGERNRNQWRTPGEILRQGVEAVLFPTQASGGIKTPWTRLTEMTSGWSPGDLIIVGGRQSMGKSVVGMQQAHATTRQGTGVAYFSIEMSKESLVRRLVAGISRVDAHRARCGVLTPDERRRMLEAAVERYLKTHGEIGQDRKYRGSFELVADILGNTPDVVRKHYGKWSKGRQDNIDRAMMAHFQTIPVTTPVTLESHEKMGAPN
jgi:replicative DNA helicase